MSDMYDKTMFDSALYNSATIKTEELQELIEPYDSSFSGIWLPLVVRKQAGYGYGYGKLLASSSLENNSKFNPCACSNDMFQDTGGTVTVEDIFNSQENLMDNLGECSYCNDQCDANPCDMKKEDDKPDKQFCDVRFNTDDYVPKIPYLYQGYISGFNDFKHLGEFPAISNPGLGFERFIQFKLNENDIQDFSVGTEKYIQIDWKLEEDIGEVPYDSFSSRHASEYIHNKSYTKSFRNKTVGNFLRTDKLQSGELPDIENFTVPHGFSNQTYDNLFHGTKRLGSHWKWNYQSGILGWYRHYDTQRANDERPLKGIDLYIPPGDIFHANNEGPETNGGFEENSCPSGLKLVEGTQLHEIIPHGTSFVYISSNIYSNFVNARDRIKNVFSDEAEILNKSLLLATHPEYDNIITDLYSNDIQEDRNTVVGQLSTLNQFMTSGTDFVSAGNINYCRTKDDLIKTLLHKYGCYYLIDSQANLRFGDVDYASSWYVDMDFDMVIQERGNRFNLTANSDTSFKFLPNAINYLNKFEYNQKIKVGDTTVMSTKHNAYAAFNESCSISDFDEVKWQESDHINISTLNLFTSTAGRLSNNSGQYSFTDMYQAGRLQHDRIYPATAFNPHVDLLALHPQGGVYVNALPFALTQKTLFDKNVNASPGGTLEVTFDPEPDVAIKLYGIKVKPLQSKKANSKAFERFPYSQEEKCKCYGFNWPDKFFGKDFYTDTNAKTWYGGRQYVPNLSTQNSPTLKKYGGYTQDYLNSLFGKNIVSAGGNIVNIGFYIDPLNPYGIEEQTSITLPNYVNTSWTVDTKNIATSRHVDLIVNASENVSLTANRFAGDPSSEDYLSNHNMSWKRFTTKVKVGGRTIYDQQANQISVTEGASLTINLSNPYLAALISDTQNAYASPDNSENLLYPSLKSYSSRGDESSAVTLTFTKKPKKHLLNFVIPPPTPYGDLSRSFFDPNYGLSTEKKNKSPFINDRMYTEYRFNEGTTEKLEDNKGIYRSYMTENMKKLCHQISDFDFNRKLRTYVKMGGAWYQIATQKRGSYTTHGKQYLGRPRFFEYLKNASNTQQIPMIYPAPPRKLFPWNFFFNHADIDRHSVSNGLVSSYPWLNGRSFAINREFITIPGARYYFTAEEEIDVIDLDITGINAVTEGITEELSSGDIIKAGTKFYFYNGGPQDEIDSYLFLGDRYEEIIGRSDNLGIEYVKDISDTGYVYNTFKGCDHKITAFINNKGIITPISERYKIIGKELRVQGYDLNGKPTINNPVQYRLQTVFQMNQSMQSIKNKVFALDIPNKKTSTSLCVFSPQNTSDYSHILKIDQGFDNSRRTKWADVIGLDDPDRMYEHIIDDLEVKNLFSDSPYNNWFYKQIINNFESRCDFELHVDDEPYYYPDMKATYCILQKYNLEDPEMVNLKSPYLYQNFIPMMDITLYNKPADQFFRKDNTNLGIPIEGQIYSPNWTRDLVEKEFDLKPPDAGGKSDIFWTEITEDDIIETAYVPTSTLYSDTLRIDDPTFWLDRVSKKTTKNTAGVRTTFTPSVPTMNSAGLSIPGFSHNIKKRDYAFSIHNIYGDGDKITECGAQGYSSCFMSTRGNTSVYAHLKIATPTSRTSLYDNTKFYTTYDAGLYNALGQRNLITISRSELNTDNPLHSSFDHCTTSYLRPDYKRTVIDPERNNTISNGIKKAQSTSVQNLDTYANEMLFRMMYGDDGDPVNRAILLSKKKPLTVSDLVNFTDPKVTAADVYDEILYNYDTKATCGSFVNNSFNVRGPMDIGDYYDFTIGNRNIYFSIEDYGGGDVRAAGRIGGKTFSVKLGGRPSVSAGVVVTDVGTTLNDTADVKYTFQKTSTGASTKLHGYVGARVYTGNCVPTYNGLCQEIKGFIQFGAYPADVNSLYDTDSEIITEHWLNPTEVYTYDVEIQNCAIPGPSTCGGNPYPSYQRNPCTTYSAVSCSDDTCDDYEIGYCRRKQDCADTKGCYVEEELRNFLYTFKQCRTTFNVYGHARKKLATGTPELDDEDTTSYGSCGGDCPEPGPIRNRVKTDEEGNTVFDEDTGLTVYEPDPDSIPETYGCLSLAGGRVYLVDGNMGGGWRTRTTARGHARSLCGGGSSNAPYHVGGDGGFALLVRGGQLGSISAGQMPRSLVDLPQERTYGCYLHPGNMEVQKWQRDNILDPCIGTSDSPQTMDPGYDVCGLVARRVYGPSFKYYTYKKVTSPAPYDGRCPRNVCTISYTNDSISITINGETTCDTASIKGCPSLEATLPAHAYISSESIGKTSDGDSNAMQINLPRQRQVYQTMRYRHYEQVGQMAGADVNSVSNVGTQAGICNRSSNQQCCESQATAICGQDSAPWQGVFDDGGTVPDSHGTFGPALSVWKEMVSDTFNTMDQEVESSSWFMPGFKKTQGTASGVERARRVCNANRHISSSDMIQGIVPGTCSSVTFSTSYQHYTKWKVANGGGYDTADDNYYITVKAYVAYDYIRPVTIQDKLKGWTPDSEGYSCSQEGNTSNARDEYPEWYARTLGVETRDVLGYEIQNYGNVDNYIRKKTWITQTNSCGESLTSYYPSDYYKDGDRNYPFGGAPCGREDYLCWADNRDWISVWED